MNAWPLSPDQVRDRVLAFISDPSAEKSFENIALDIFACQFENNPAYRRWCDSVGAGPGNVSTPEDIPPVPVSAFKELELVCGSARAEFRTSGTSGTGTGRHLIPDLEPYRAGSLKHFARCLLPEGWNMRMLILAPPPDLRPHSSLSRMLAWVVEEYGEEGSSWFVEEEGFRLDRLTEALLDCQRNGAPILIAGTTAAFFALFENLVRQRLAIRLPGGSRLMDTGGRKGTGVSSSQPLDLFQESFHLRAEELLGIPPGRCVNEYGMTELSSQFYDGVLASGARGNARVKLAPHWVRTRILDPVTLAPVNDGEPGLLQHLDLANAGSVISVLTEDFGRRAEDGFVLLGRARPAEARGCGMTFEELTGRR